MIIADRKPIEEIFEMIKEFDKILIVGCKGCVTVCNVGGAKEVDILAAILKIGRKKKQKPLQIDEKTLERQCDLEYIAQIKDTVNKYDAVLSMACGVGLQFLAEAYPNQKFFPAVNTKFFGGATAHGIWEERCAGCGICIVHYFGGLCPIARCSKSLMNGPCGGSAEGKCEIDKNVACIWDLIVRKKMEHERLDDLLDITPAKDWRSAKDGGPRRRECKELIK